MVQKIFSARKSACSGERHKPTKRFQQNADGGVLASRFSSCQLFRGSRREAGSHPCGAWRPVRGQRDPAQN